MFHINPDTGKPGECVAKTPESCLYSTNGHVEEHYKTEKEAREAYELKQSDKLFLTKMLPSISSKLNMSFPAYALTRKPLKELDSVQLSQTLRYEAKRLNLPEKEIDSAISLATILHSHQTRSNRGNFVNTPYVEHPLRNSLRLIRWGIKDKDVIIATVLHDVIEDGAQRFVKDFHGVINEDELKARDSLSRYIEKTYGSNVLRLVQSVTNDYIANKKSMPLGEKRSIYYEHVKKSITNNNSSFLLKLTDIIDNAAGLHHNDIAGRELKTYNQAKKYLPVVKMFIKELPKLSSNINNEQLNCIKISLEKTIGRLDSIIDKYDHLE